jgi:AAA domain-containing protein
MHHHREGARAPVLVAPASELKHTVRRVHFSTHIDIFRIKQNSNQVDFWIADPLPLNHLIFCTQQRNGETVVVDVLLDITKKASIQEKRLNGVVYEMTCFCNLLFSIDVTAPAPPGIAIADLLQQHENSRMNCLTTALSERYLALGVQNAKKSKFQLEVYEYKLTTSKSFVGTVHEKDRTKYHTYIESCQTKRSIVNIEASNKEQPSFPATIQKWDRDQGVLSLQVEPTSMISDSALKALPSDITITYDTSLDLKKQLKALQKLTKTSARINTLPLDLFLLGPDEELLASIRPIYEQDKSAVNLQPYLRKDLNEEQKEAIQLALATPDFFLLQGPPGTGKTTFIAELCSQIVRTGGSVLISSQGNLAVDNALSRLDNHPEIRAVRIGNKQRIHDIGKHMHKEHAFQHWLHVIADDVKGEILRLRSAIAVQVLLEEQWEEISEQYHCYETLQQHYENTFFEQARQQWPDAWDQISEIAQIKNMGTP